jgi:hypothetical protein
MDRPGISCAASRSESNQLAPKTDTMPTDTALHVLHTLASWRFFLVPVFIGGPILAIVSSAGSTSGRRRMWRILAIPTGVVLGIGNLIFGPELSATLIHRYGNQGQAIVTGSFDTGNVYNDRRVMGHNVLIRTANGQTVETRFEDDDFNVYPSDNDVYYPQEGDHFNVSYLEGYPSDFIIIADDDSPWAKALRCTELESAVREAESKQRFAPDSSTYRKSYDDAAQAAKAAGCSTTSDDE